MTELEDRNRELEAGAAAAALESLASPSATTPQRPVPSRAKGTDKENAGSAQINSRRALKVLYCTARYFTYSLLSLVFLVGGTVKDCVKCDNLVLKRLGGAC